MKLKTFRMMTSAFALVGVAAFIPSVAFAQDAPQSDSAKTGIGDIIVTAQRTSQKLNDVPMSITAATGEQLDNAGIRQVSDLQLTTPGFAPSNSSGYNQMFIRGVGNAIFVGADPSVATFIDDVPRVFGTTVNNLVDVERVEIIKGAPGALYGRNATGGAVNIITRQPSTEEVKGRARISFGTKDTFQASAYVNLPLGENAAWSVSGERRSHGGYIKNLTPDTNGYTAAMFPVNGAGGPGTASFFGTPAQTAALLNSGFIARKSYANEDFWAVGSKLLFQPSDTFKITFAGDYSKKDDDSGNGGYSTTPDWGVTALNAFFLSAIGVTSSPALLSSFAVPVNEKFATKQRSDGFVKLKDWGVSATAVLELGGADLTSITSYRKNESDFMTEGGFEPWHAYSFRVQIKKKTFNQELRAVSNGDGPLNWIVGASYLRAEFDGGLATNFLAPVGPFTPAGATKYVVSNWSAFAQLGYDVTENLNLMVGGRYIDEKNDAVVKATGRSFNLKESKFLPSATIKYSLENGGNIYARWARGFKAGGVVPVSDLSVFTDPFSQGGIFKGEEIDTFELGLKTPLAGNRVNLTAAVFYNDYRNVQITGHVTPAFQSRVSLTVINAGSARTYGAEMGLNARVSPALTVGATAGYLNARYREFKVTNNPVQANFDYSGQRMTNSPEWQLSFNANLDQPISDSLKLVGNAVAAHTSRTIWIQSGQPTSINFPPFVTGFPNGGILPDAVEPGYWLVNARLGVASADDKWELAVYAKNLFNSAYSTFGSSNASNGNSLIWGDPRIIGVEGTFKF